MCSTYGYYVYLYKQIPKFLFWVRSNSLLLLLLLLSNGRSWIYSNNLLASQYSFDNSLEVRSSFGHTRRWSPSIVVFFGLHIVQELWLRILMRWRCAARQSWPVLSRKFATACFLSLSLLFSHVVLMFRHCVLLDAAMASWENFSWGFCFISLLIVSKLSDACLFWSVVPFFASGSAVSLPWFMLVSLSINLILRFKGYLFVVAYTFLIVRNSAPWSDRSFIMGDIEDKIYSTFSHKFSIMSC